LTSILVASVLASAFSLSRVPASLRSAFPVGSLPLFLAPLALAALFFRARAVDPDLAIACVRTACFAGAAIAGVLVLVRRVHEPIEKEREHLLAILEAPSDVTLVLDNDATESTAPSRVKAGQRVRFRAGECVLVDGVVATGGARVHPFVDASSEESRAVGEPVVAGATVLEGEIVLTATWLGDDRGAVRALKHPAARLDRNAASLSTAERLVLGGPPAIALVAGIATSLSSGWLDGAMVAAASLTALPIVACWVLASRSLARTGHAAVARGIHYRDAAAFDGAGRVERVALCSGSALTAGNPEVVALESVGTVASDAVLALAALACAGTAHAVGRAIVRAAKRSNSSSPNLAPHAALGVSSLRTVTHHSGLGVTAQAPGGERVVVGSRMLCMKESVSVALAEERIADLERKGRTVVLVALGGRLLGWIALQDELRAGARAAVERLVRAGVEPVLLSGAARETAEALASALAIEHVRPEVPPDERGAEVRALATSGASVATIGHPDVDDGALGAAGVSVALGAAGAPAGEWTVTLATRRPDAAADAIALAHSARDDVRRICLPSALPGLLVVLGLATSFVPMPLTWLAPLFGFGGVVLGFRRARQAP
jgi:cation transport ATPase